MKKIAIFQADLKVGGIQRSLVNLLGSSILDEYHVDVFLFSRDIFYDTSSFKENIHIHFLKPFPYWFRCIPFSLIRRMKLYTEIKDQYDFAFDYDSYRQECAYCTTKMNCARKILWIHSDIEKELLFNWKYRILYLFFKEKYKFYDEFIAVSQGVIEPFRKHGNKKAKIRIIPNIINVKQILSDCHEKTKLLIDSTKINIVCVGRIHIQKGYDLFLNDFLAAYKARKDLRCYIIGDGPDLYYYKKWIKRHALEDVVFFLGNQKNPFAIMNQMDALCLESRSEGQGMVLWEAKCLGLQLIFPKRLEKYNILLKGEENVREALINLVKKEKQYTYLEEYHDYIEKQYRELFLNLKRI
ncbi:MAG: glycosyltransferase [Lachnospiraceae bacterium]|nr:glycosyltransferase [Lachnospiraceae bacterium]